MSSWTIQKLMLSFYMVLFFGFLFAPLIMMGIAAFNDVSFPQVVPWEGFTLRWFPALFDDALMMEGFANSIWIGLGVVCLSVPIGLAAAIMMTQVHRRVQALTLRRERAGLLDHHPFAARLVLPDLVHQASRVGERALVEGEARGLVPLGWHLGARADEQTTCQLGRSGPFAGRPNQRRLVRGGRGGWA